MAFDLASAQPVAPSGGFDLASAAPVTEPSAPAAPTKYDPTEGMSTSDKFLAGAGKAFVDTFRGVRQLGAHMGLTHEKPQDIQAEIDEAKQRDQSLMATRAGTVGNIVGQAAPMLLAPEAGILGSAAEGAALASAQPVATGESRLQNAGMGAIGGGVGAGVGKILGGILGGFGGAGSRQAAVDTLKAEGIPLSVAQQTGKKAAQTVERASAMTSDAPAEFATQQGHAFTRSVLRRIGVHDPEVTAATPDVLGPARAKITGVMDDVANRTQIKYDPALESDLAAIEQNALRQVPVHDLGPIHTNLNDILENASTNNGALDGNFYQRLNSNLGALSKDPKVGPVAGDIKDAINDALQRSANPDDVAALAKARQQYRAMKQIEPAVDPATGMISPLKLINSLATKTNRSQALYGKGDQSLMDLARAAKQVMPETLGNSGTAERALPALAALETLASGDAIKAGIKGGVGVLGLNAAGRAMRNQGITGQYLTSGIPGVRAATPVITRAAPAIGYGTAESQPRDDAAPRASGGKVDTDALVGQLLKRWKRARRATNESTKPLLNMPDTAVAKALDIAGRSL